LKPAVGTDLNGHYGSIDKVSPSISNSSGIFRWATAFQTTTPNRELSLANREMGTIEKIDTKGLHVAMDNGRHVTMGPRGVAAI
jgi:hypothetical protein